MEGFYYDHFIMNNHDSLIYTIGVYNTSLHNHYDAEMGIVWKGSMKVTIGSKTWSLSPGGIFFVNALNMHAYMADEDYCFCTFIVVNKDSIARLMPELTDSSLSFVIENNNVQDLHLNKIRTLLLLAYKNSFATSNIQPMRCQAYILLALCFLFEHAHDYCIQQNTVITEDDTRKRQIASYILDNFQHDITLNSLAKHIHLSADYTAHYFKDTFQQTFKQYLSYIRIVNAKRLLGQPDMTITEVALTCGFGSIATFNRVFKNLVGVTPSTFQASLVRKNQKGQIHVSAKDTDFYGKYSTYSGNYISFQRIAMQNITRALCWNCSLPAA